MKPIRSVDDWIKFEKKFLISQKIHQVLDYINENFYQELKLAEVGRRFGYHPDYLCRKFKKELGVPFHDLVLRIRVQKAMDLLAESEKGIKEISFEVGFSRPEVFSRAFKRLAGCSPRDFRNKYPQALGGVFQKAQTQRAISFPLSSSYSYSFPVSFSSSNSK